MGSVLVHTIFDVLAWLAAGAAMLWLVRIERIEFPAIVGTIGYLAPVVAGAGVGAFVFGTANLWLSGETGFARSIEGGIAGGIIAVELYKRMHGIATRTGARFALPFAAGVAVGRIGCYLAGLDDFTYGTPTSLPWAHDFGDGVPRHPVQLYESAAMAAFALYYVVGVRRRDRFVIDNGFYLAVAFYGAQRFCWEFIKPYGTLIGPLSLFHLLSIALVAYAIGMLLTSGKARSANDRAFA